MSVISLEEWRRKLADTSTSASQSQPTHQSGELGEIPIDEEEIQGIAEVYAVLSRAKAAPFTTKSDFARVAANPIALAASEGLLSTRLNENTYTNRWMITREGLDWMEGFDDVFGPR